MFFDLIPDPDETTRDYKAEARGLLRSVLVLVSCLVLMIVLLIFAPAISFLCAAPLLLLSGKGKRVLRALTPEEHARLQVREILRKCHRLTVEDILKGRQ